MYNAEPKKTIRLYSCTSFASRITDYEFFTEFKDMSRSDPVEALRLFTTTCFISRFYEEDAHEFRNFVIELKRRDSDVALSLLTKGHFPKRIKRDDAYDRLWLDMDTLGTRFNIPICKWCKILSAQRYHT